MRDGVMRIRMNQVWKSMNFGREGTKALTWRRMNWARERDPLKRERITVVTWIAGEGKIKKRKRVNGMRAWNGVK